MYVRVSPVECDSATVMVHQHIGHFAQDAVDGVAARGGVVAGDGVVAFEEVLNARLAILDLGKQRLPQTTRVVGGFGATLRVARLARSERVDVRVLIPDPVTRLCHTGSR